MNEAVTWLQIVIALISIAGALGGVWWRLQSQVYELKIHVSENFITKAGMTEQTDRVMNAIERLDTKIDRTNERLDQAFSQARPAPRTGR
ncbi:hypothetical protein LJR231_003445 [Phyllobacterium sp. LjRoot231]|uniref:hypothetical protein n=1 Tax=Phyllobacterium sp. LjRoot231 TaxID=3342289 RepID=UPI003ED16C1E